MHQMGFAEPDTAVKKEWIERHHAHLTGASLGDAARRRVGQLVGLADNKILKGEARIEARRPIFPDLQSGYGFSHW